MENDTSSLTSTSGSTTPTQIAGALPDATPSSPGLSSTTAPTSGSDTSSTKTPEEELYCAEIQRRLLEAETRKPFFPDDILKGPRILFTR